jgi:hypothetical protein
MWKLLLRQLRWKTKSEFTENELMNTHHQYIQTESKNFKIIIFFTKGELIKVTG